MLLQNYAVDRDLHLAGHGCPPGARGSRQHPYASLPMAGAELSHGAEGCPPVGGNPNGPTEANLRHSSGSIRVAEKAKAAPDFVRAGRPRSRRGILHTTNREHRFHHAQKSDKEPDSTLQLCKPNMVYILPGNRAGRPMQASSITPPLRGSRRDKGAARSRSGGGQTRRPVSTARSRAGGGQTPHPGDHIPSRQSIPLPEECYKRLIRVSSGTHL